MLRIMTSDERKVRVCSPVWHVLSPKNGMVRDPSPWEGQLWKEGVVNGVLVLLFPLQFSVEILHVLHRVPGAPCVTQTGFSKLSQDSLRTSACNPLRLWGSLHDTICSLLAITYSTLKKIVCIILLKIIFTIYHTRPQGVATPYQPTYHTRRRDNVGETGSCRGHTLSGDVPAGPVCRSSSWWCWNRTASCRSPSVAVSSAPTGLSVCCWSVWRHPGQCTVHPCTSSAIPWTRCRLASDTTW